MLTIQGSLFLVFLLCEKSSWRQLSQWFILNHSFILLSFFFVVVWVDRKIPHGGRAFMIQLNHSRLPGLWNFRRNMHMWPLHSLYKVHLILGPSFFHTHSSQWVEASRLSFPQGWVRLPISQRKELVGLEDSRSMCSCQRDEGILDILHTLNFLTTWTL